MMISCGYGSVRHELFRDWTATPSQSFGRPKTRLASRNNGSGLMKAIGTDLLDARKRRSSADMLLGAGKPIEIVAAELKTFRESR